MISMGYVEMSETAHSMGFPEGNPPDLSRFLGTLRETSPIAYSVRFRASRDVAALASRLPRTRQIGQNEEPDSGCRTCFRSSGFAKLL
jgi:hypothetical protein